MVCRSLLVDRLASFGHVGATQGSGEASNRPMCGISAGARGYPPQKLAGHIVCGLMKEPLVSLNKAGVAWR